MNQNKCLNNNKITNFNSNHSIMIYLVVQWITKKIEAIFYHFKTMSLVSTIIQKFNHNKIRW